MAAHRILVVDDDPGIVTLITAILKRDGYNALSAYSGEDALALYASAHPDLILLDLAMPEVTGFEVLEELRQREAETGRRTPIILLTAYTQSYFVSQGIHPDVQGYLTKPVTSKKLLEDVRRLLAE